MMDSLDYANRNYEVPYYNELGQGALKVFAKRVIRKLVKCVVFPIVALQNAWNARAVRCLNQLTFSEKEQRRQLEEQQQEIWLLQALVESHEQEIQSLREQLEEYKSMLATIDDLPRRI